MASLESKTTLVRIVMSQERVLGRPVLPDVDAGYPRPAAPENGSYGGYRASAAHLPPAVIESASASLGSRSVVAIR